MICNNPESVGVAERSELQNWKLRRSSRSKSDVDVRHVRDDSRNHFLPAVDYGKAQVNRSETFRRGFEQSKEGPRRGSIAKVRKRYLNLGSMVTSTESNNSLCLRRLLPPRPDT